MRQTLAIAAILTTAIAVASVAAGEPATQRHSLEQAVAAPTRSPANVARDQYRHPVETLAFFGVKPSDTVVEIWPGGGWYTEILAPLTNGKGTLYAANPWPDGAKGIQKLQSKDAATYGRVKLAAFPVTAADQPKVPDGTADICAIDILQRIGWRQRPDPVGPIRAVLRIGVHLRRADIFEPRPLGEAAHGGDLDIARVALALVAGAFRQAVILDAQNAAMLEHRVHLPEGFGRIILAAPVLAHPPIMDVAEGEDEYAAIGESDRMTLKFRKP